MNKKFLRVESLLLIVAVLVLICTPTAMSLPGYATTLQSVYGIGTCTTCHPSGGPPPFTAYGSMFQAVSNHSNDPVGALQSIGSPTNATPSPTPTATPTVTPTPTATQTPVPTPPSIPQFAFAVEPKSTFVGPNIDAIYNLTIGNVGSSSDIYSLTIDNPDKANVSLSKKSITLGVGKSSSTELTVRGSTTGTFTVNVTATSNNTNNSINVSTDTTVAIGKIENSSVSNGTRSGALLANVTVMNLDSVGHWFVVVVGGTDPVIGYPLVGTGAIFIAGKQTNSTNIPVLVTIPASANIGDYDIFAGLYTFDNKTLEASNLIGNVVGPATATVS